MNEIIALRIVQALKRIADALEAPNPENAESNFFAQVEYISDAIRNLTEEGINTYEQNSAASD